MTLNDTQRRISSICDDVKELLLVRIDDKLNRIMKGVGLVEDDEDVVMDLIGYLILLKMALENEK